MGSQQGFASLLSLFAFVSQPKSVVVPVEGGAGTKNAVSVTKRGSEPVRTGDEGWQVGTEGTDIC